MLPYTRKYQPRLPSDIAGQDSALRQIESFITNFKKQKKKALFLWGPSGTGKTASAHAVASKHSLEIIEINASDVRNKEQIDQRVGNALFQQSLFYRSKVILVDEVDGLSGMEDRGGVQAIASLIDKAPFPIILTAYTPYNNKLNTLRSRSILIEFKPLDYLSVYKVLKKIASAEGIKHNDDSLKSLARRSGGDMRAAINDLQLLSKGQELKKEDIETLHDRLRTESIIQALMKVFKTTDPSVSLPAFDNVMEDTDKIMLWLDENLPREYTNPADLARAYDSLSKADVFRGRIRRWQHWRFLVYINALITAGISLAKDERYKTFTQYRPTMKLLKIWQANMKYQKRKAIAQKIADKSHASSKRVLESALPYFKVAFKKNISFASSMASYLGLDEDEVEWLRK